MNAFKNKPVIIIGIISVFYLIAGFNFEINIYDEAIGVVGAERILAGELPYLDFWTIYAPGIFYFNAGLLSLFGTDLFVLRLTTIAIILLMAYIGYKFNSKALDNKIALIPFLILIVWSNFGNLYFRSLLPALVLTFLCMYLLYNYIQDSNKKWIWLSGITMAFIGIFRHDMGGYLFGTFFQVVFWASLSHEEIQGKKVLKKIFYGIKQAMYFAYGTALIAIPIGALILISIPFDQLYNQLIEVPLGVFSDYRNLPFPNPFDVFSADSARHSIVVFWEGIVFYIPLAIYILTVITIVYRVKKKTMKLGGSQFWFEMLVFNVGINLYNHAMVRSDIEHLYPTLIFAAILMVNLIMLLKNSFLRNTILLISVLFLLAIPLSKKVLTLKEFASNSTIELASDRSQNIFIDKSFADKYESVLNFINNNIPKEDKIYVGCKGHDKVLLNHVMLYYLSGRMPSVKYHELHPGITTTEAVQKELINSLENTSYVILVDENEYENSNKSSKSSHVTILDEYINTHYEVVKKIDEYEILRRL